MNESRKGEPIILKKHAITINLDDSEQARLWRNYKTLTKSNNTWEATGEKTEKGTIGRRAVEQLIGRKLSPKTIMHVEISMTEETPS